MKVKKVLSYAKKLNDRGFTKLADKLVTRTLGQQIGRTTKSGLRGFCDKNVEQLRGGWMTRCVDEIDSAALEKAITVIDKDYNVVGQTLIRRKHKVPRDITSFEYTQIERLLLPKKNDLTQTCRFDITGFYGNHITSEPGSTVMSKHYRSRIAREPEFRYGYGNKIEGRYRTGDTIYDRFHYSYRPMNRDGKIVNSYSQIDYIYGGEAFFKKVNAVLDKWHEYNRVIRPNF